MTDVILNPKQQEAVDTIEGPLLVLAGPGTGKTQLLSSRVVNILQKTDTLPNSILCLTFTETGASNMRNRLVSLIGQSANDIEINTYHGFAQTIISANREYFIDKKLNKVIDEITAYEYVKEIVDKLPLNNVLKSIEPQNIISTINEFKQALLKPEDVLNVSKENAAQIKAFDDRTKQLLGGMTSMPRKATDAEILFGRIFKIIDEIALDKSVLPKFPSLLSIAKNELREAIEEYFSLEKPSTKPFTAWRQKWLEKNRNGDRLVFKDNFNQYRLETMASIYAEYSQKMKDAGLYDFNDMILTTIETIEKNPDLKYNLQEKYLYILLDEYQDTNLAQSKIIELLTDNPVSEGRPNVMAVGDDDQAIYAFQGANFSNMLDFYHRYRDTKLINLGQNYRSHKSIIETALNITGQIEDRIAKSLSDKVTKDLTQANPDILNGEIDRIDFDNPISQNKWVADKIKCLQQEGASLNEIAILSPRHKSLEKIAPYLAVKNIPVRYEKSENVLENPGIKVIIAIAKLISALNDARDHNHLVFETLSYPIWGLEVEDVWNLSWKASKKESWLKFIIEDESQIKLRPIAKWLLEFASKSNNLSLEANFDILIGNLALSDFTSPIKDYYQNSQPKKLIDFALDLNLLRENYLEYARNHPDAQTKPLEHLTRLVDVYRQAGIKMSRANTYNESSDAVNVMTVFSAKGLEFKHVFIIEANDNTWGKARPNSNKVALPANLKPIRHDAEDLDEKARIFFVAITRAKTNLYILNPLNGLTGKHNNRLRFLDEVESEDGVFSRALPNEKQLVKKSTDLPTYEDLILNLNDDFSDWKARHDSAIATLRDLLAPKLESFKLSPTALNSYSDLKYSGPKAYFLKHIVGYPGAYDLRSIYGSAFHYLIDSLSRKAEPISKEKALSLFTNNLEEYNLTETDFDTIFKWGKEAIPVFLQARANLFEEQNYKVATEVDVRNVVFGGARIGGKIDRLEIDETNKTITVVDFKTGKTHKKISKSDMTSYKYIKQLYFYKILLNNSPDYRRYDVNKWRLEFVAPDTENQINVVEEEFNSEDEQRVAGLIKAVWAKTMNLDFDEPAKKEQVSIKDIKEFEDSILTS